MSHPDMLLLILGMGLVTYLPRLFPLVFLSRRQLPQGLVEWLDLIPVAILSALVFPELFVSGTPRHLDPLQLKVLVAIPTFLFALRTRSLGGTVLLGMFATWLAERWL